MASSQQQPSKATVVGHMFLTHFYKILSLSPEKLYSLYVNDAVFSFGDESDRIPSYSGVNSIKDAIEKLDFKGCSAVISSADYQATYNGAVLILTVGTFYRPSKDGDVSVRRFVQNFLLVPQGQSAFCIMSHSMLFLKESEQSTTTATTNVATVDTTTSNTTVESSSTTATAAPTPATSTPVTSTAPATTSAPTTAAVEPAPTPVPTPAAPTATATAAATAEQTSSSKHSKSHSSKGAKSTTTTTAAAPTTSSATPAATTTTTTAAASTATAPAKSATDKPVKKSWATIVGTEGQATATPAATTPAATTNTTTAATAATTATTTAASTTTTTAATTAATTATTTAASTTTTTTAASTTTAAGGNQTGQTKRPWQKTRPDGSTAPSRDAFISNLPYTATEEQVRARFATYGTIKKLNLQKGTAHIEFESPESVANAIKDAKQKLVELDGRQIHVDDRKRVGPKGKFIHKDHKDHKDQRAPSAGTPTTGGNATGGARTGAAGTGEKRPYRPRPASGTNGN